MSRRLSDGGRTSFKESKLWKFIKPDLGTWCLLVGEVVFGGVALYAYYSQPSYLNNREPTKIESPRDQYSSPIAYDPYQGRR